MLTYRPTPPPKFIVCWPLWLASPAYKSDPPEAHRQPIDAASIAYFLPPTQDVHGRWIVAIKSEGNRGVPEMMATTLEEISALGPEMPTATPKANRTPEQKEYMRRYMAKRRAKAKAAAEAAATKPVRRSGRRASQ